MKPSEYVRGYRSAVSYVRNGSFTLDGIPTNRETARAVLGHLLQERGLPFTWANTSLGYVTEFYHYSNGERSQIAYWPIVWCDVQATAEFAQIERSGLGRELRLAGARLNGGTGSDYARRSIRRWRDLFSFQRSPSQTFVQKIRALPLVPSTFKYDRALGVELECFGEIAARTLADKLPLWAARANDCSIRATDGEGHEIRALLWRREAEPRLYKLTKLLADLGLAVNSSCGFHVHLDQRGETEAAVVARAKIMDAWLSHLVELVPASRRDNRYCRFGVSLSDRYKAVNVCCFKSKQTLEVRLHSGTLDYTKIISWVRLVELLAAMPKKPKAGGCMAVLEQLPLASHDLAYWRARHRELNPHLYASATTVEQEG